MGARGFNVAEEGHVVSILSPQSISGGVTSTPFHMKYAAKANIIIQYGALAGAPGAITVKACSDASGDGATAIPFTYYTKSAAGNTADTLDLVTGPSAANSATAEGFTPADNINTFVEIVIQSDQLPAGLPYIEVTLASGAVANYASAVAILTGLSYAGSQQPTVTT
ncbi:hypothetical protein GOB94_14050 [Granulicella sp. 5B5]|uniref:hypothetical protein n=1 Tax=Granulicella sp. 5B5 TaxID=1617967 RepID=UPI0015F408D5|nr:hypothetical protein [Granulicella sp. 5B5]QMV19688.1 hypothetical protein GOB94_14050 [Granulicella sp. 5B5]